MTCQIWQVQNSRRFAGFPAPPDCGERVFLQNRPVGKQKQAVAAFQLGAGFKKRCHSRGNRGDGENAEAMDAKTPLDGYLAAIEATDEATRKARLAEARSLSLLEIQMPPAAVGLNSPPTLR